MSVEAALVLTQDIGPVRRLVLNRPRQSNALSRALLGELLSALDDCETSPGVHAVILGGAGDGFCAGADLKAAGTLDSAEAIAGHAHLMSSLLTRPWTLSKPVVAQVHGFALGAGCGLALACDAVLITAEARLGFPEIARGLLPALVAPIVERQVGRKTAFELLGSGRSVTGDRAAALGLADVAPAEELASAALRRAEELAGRPAGLIGALKGLLNRIDGARLPDAMHQARAANIESKLGRLAPHPVVSTASVGDRT